MGRHALVVVILVLLGRSLHAEITYLDALTANFRSPAGVDVAPDERLFVADQGRQSIKVFDTDGRQIDSFFVDSPRDVSVSRALTRANNGDLTRPVFVADINDRRNIHQIRRFSDTGTSQLNFGSLGSELGQFNRPLGLDTNLIGDVFVADTENHRIQRFDIDGNFLDAFGTSGSALGEFNAPSDVAVGPLGNLYVADRNNHRVQKFDSAGSFIFALAGFDDPTSLDVTDQGLLYVADRDNHRIQRFGPDGSLQASFGSQGNGAGQLDTPLGVAVADTGFVYVADSVNNRIQRFFDSDAWVRGRVELIDPRRGPVNVAVGSEIFFAGERINRVSLGRTYRLRTLMDLVVGANTRIVADGLLTIDGGSLTTDSLDVDGRIEFLRGTLDIGSHGLTVGVGGPFGRYLNVDQQSRISLGGDFVVGNALSGELRVAGGSTVENLRATLATTPEAAAQVTVHGFDSLWRNAQTILGQRGSARLDVLDGGRVESLSANLAEQGTAAAQVNLQGFDSRWDVETALTIGINGGAVVTAAGAAQLTSAAAVLAAEPGSSGRVVLSDHGTRWNNSAALSVGRKGHGLVEITGGSRLATGSLTIGEEPEGSGSVVVLGFGSELVTGDLTLGSAGEGELIAAAGASLTSGNVNVAGAQGVGQATLHGTGTRWQVGGTLELGSEARDSQPGDVSLGNGAELSVGENIHLFTGSRLVVAGQASVAQDIQVQAEATLQVDGGDVQAQRLNVQPTGTFHLSGGQVTTENRLINRGRTTLTGGPSLSAEAIQNFGTWVGGGQVSGPFVNETTGVLTIDAGERLATAPSADVNRGRIDLRQGELAWGGAFENAAGSLIAGRGTLAAGTNITNRGEMIFSGGQSDIHGDFNNLSGALVLSTGGGTVTFFDDVRSPSGEIRASEGSSIVFLGSFSGSTSGSGTTVIEGVLSPGNSPGIAQFGGDLVLRDRTLTVLELAGTVAGEGYDQVLADGQIALAGTASVDHIDGYDGPARGSAAEYVLLRSEAGLTGSFASFELDGTSISFPTTPSVQQLHFGEGYFRTLERSPTTFTLVDYLAIPGDADGDRMVAFSDFLLLSNHFDGPGSWTEGDFDGDGSVRFSDFLLLSENFGTTVATTVATVPEPAGGLLLGLCCLGLWRRRRS